jgi:tetratricopeptide (TPR) repeat protein
MNPWAAAGAALIALALSGCVRERGGRLPGNDPSAPPPSPAAPEAASAPAAPATPVPAVAPAPAESPPRPGKEADFERILRSLPAEMLLAKKEVIREVEGGIVKAEEVLAADAKTPGVLTAGERGNIRYALAFFLMISFERTVQAGKSKPLDLANRILDLAAGARTAFPEGSRRAAECRAVEGQVLLKRSWLHTEEAARLADLDASRDAYRKLLEIIPDWPDRGAVHADIADSFFREGNYEDARKHIEKVLDAEPGMPDAAYCDEKLFEALTWCGDLDAMEALVLRRMADYPARLKDPKVTNFDTEVIGRLLDTGQFWLGHIRLALGDRAEARACFLRHIAEIDAKEAEGKTKGESLNAVARIFRDFRSRDLLRFVDERMGNRPEIDFDLGDLWCTEERPTLASSRGKVFAAFFGLPSSPRSAPFLKALDGIWRKEHTRGLEAVVIAMRGGGEARDQVEGFRASLARAGIVIPAGLDPNMPVPLIFRKMGAVVSPAMVNPTATFVVFDREGRFAWYLPDPLPADAGVARAVIERLLAK